MDDIEEQFYNAVGAMISRKCWCVGPGGSLGSMLRLHIGDKIKRDKPLRFGVPAIRDHYGEMLLFLEGASWRLKGPRGPLCSSKDNSALNGKLVEAISKITDLEITGVHVTSALHDLTVEFEGGIKLEIFCHYFDQARPVTNYRFRSPVTSMQSLSIARFENWRGRIK